MRVLPNNVAGQLIACASQELQTSLEKLTVRKFLRRQTYLIEERKKLVVKYQASAVYLEELLNLKQEDGESVRHYLARLKGVSNRCEFSAIICKCCKEKGAECCSYKVSYADNITKYKLV